MMHYTRPVFTDRVHLRKLTQTCEVYVLARTGYCHRGKYNDPVNGTLCVAGEDGRPVNVEIRNGFITRIVGTS